MITMRKKCLGEALLSSIVEDVSMSKESSRLPPGVRNVLLASLNDMQKTGKRRTISRYEREPISGKHPQ
jgi:hypothetical protein